MQRMETLTNENTAILKKYNDIKVKYQGELESKNELINNVLEKQKQLDDLTKQVHFQQTEFQKFKEQKEKELFIQQSDIKQEMVMIETDRKLLFEKLD